MKKRLKEILEKMIVSANGIINKPVFMKTNILQKHANIKKHVFDENDDDAIFNKYFEIDFEKVDKKKKMASGYASTPDEDSDGDIITLDAIKDALPDYLEYSNIREMHQPIAVGVVKKHKMTDKGLYIDVKVVDANAWEKVLEGVYKGFSIGGRILEAGDRYDESTGRYLGKTIKKLKLVEISLVDRPANPKAKIEVVKFEKNDIFMRENAENWIDIKKVLTKNDDNVTFQTKSNNYNFNSKTMEKFLEKLIASIVDTAKSEGIKIDLEKMNKDETKNDDMKKFIDSVAELTTIVKKMGDKVEKNEDDDDEGNSGGDGGDAQDGADAGNQDDNNAGGQGDDAGNQGNAGGSGQIAEAETTKAMQNIVKALEKMGETIEKQGQVQGEILKSFKKARGSSKQGDTDIEKKNESVFKGLV